MADSKMTAAMQEDRGAFAGNRTRHVVLDDAGVVGQAVGCVGFELAEDGARGDAEGTEADAEVALTAAEIASILAEGGVETCLLQVGDSTDGLLTALRDFEPQAVFNLVESVGNEPSREPEVPLLLEAAGMPYTGNSPIPLRVAHAKDVAKQILAAHCIPHAIGFTNTVHRDVMAGARLYQKRKQRLLGDDTADWLALNSPRQFGQYSIARLLDTLPAR